MHKLTPEDKLLVEQFDREFGRYLETIKKSQSFKLDDFLILKVGTYGAPLELYKNSYGAPIKYRVVHIDSNGVAFVKRINKNGEPIGKISTCVGLKTDEYYEGGHSYFEWELDPDFADSIILQDNYDPSCLHRSKKDIWKAVTEHNKACKVPTQDIVDVVKFFHAINIGDTMWTSNVGSYHVRDKKIMTPSDFNKASSYTLHTRIKGPYVTVLTVVDKHGKVKDITPDFFHWKALYKDRPRTYKELNI